MPLWHEGWRTGEEKAKTAKIVRSLAQDQARSFKKETMRWIYPPKMKEGIDIGEVCTKWHYVVLTMFSFSHEFLETVISMIRFSYLNGDNLDKDESFLDYIAIYGTPMFASKVDDMPIIAKLSFMGDLDKPAKKRNAYNDAKRW